MTEIEKKAETFMGHKLNDNGEVVGAIPEFQHIMTDFTDRIIKEQERYVYKECWKLNIDPKVLEKQLIEIKRCQFMITQKDVEITELKAQIEKMKCCDNCIHCHRQYEDINCNFKNEYDDVICSRGYNGEIDGWELAE